MNGRDLTLGIVAGLAVAGAVRQRGGRNHLPTVYHVTTREAADDILRNGFLPGWGDIGLGVYFYGSEREAMRYAQKGGWDGALRGKHVVVLAVQDLHIRRIGEADLDPSWDRSKYADMWFWESRNEDEDAYMVPLGVLVASDLGLVGAKRGAHKGSASLNLCGGRNAEALRNDLLPTALRDTHDLVVTDTLKRTSHWEPTGVGNGVTSVPYTYHTLVATLYPRGERWKESRLGQVAATHERRRETPIPLRGRCAADLVRLGGPDHAFGVTGAFVDERLRGKGVGQALYAALVEAAGTHGGALTSNRCLTGTELTSADALRVWERLGRRYAVEGEVAWSRKGSAARGSRARHSLPYHLRFLEGYLGARHKGLRAYFPETAKGTLKPRKGESWYAAEGIQYLGDDDGTMVPIDAEHLEPMPENIFYPDKFSALVEAVEAGKNPGVHPGYADLDVEDGALTAQVRDGNHRTFAAIAAGGTMSWVMMSDRTRQDLDERTPGSESLYRAIRAAQKAAGVPLFTRRAASKAKGPKKEMDRLVAMQVRRMELLAVEEEHYRAMLRKWGRFEQTAYSLSEQLERAQIFWGERIRELKEKHGTEWIRENLFNTPEQNAKDAAWRERSAQFSDLYDLRQKMGLKRGERLDPVTRKPVEDR